MKKCRKPLVVSILGLLAFLLWTILFLLWTILVLFVDVKPIGPQGSNVGLSTVNGAFHKLTGVNMTLYDITDWLGLVPIGVMMFFTLLGLVQWIKRKKIARVDLDILALGSFYIVVFVVFLMFETFVVNFRPVLINGYLEASYPSSTTMLVMCVIPTAIIKLRSRLLRLALALFAAFMVVARTISGVHWITDIIGGVLISISLVSLYSFIIKTKTTPKS